MVPRDNRTSSELGFSARGYFLRLTILHEGTASKALFELTPIVLYSRLVIKVFRLNYNMNFYPIPPVITAELYVRVPDCVRCTEESEWRGGFTGDYQNIFLEGPTVDQNGDLFITDIPHGQILKIDREAKVTRCVKYDGEPNGMAIRSDGKFVVADYKKVK